MTSSLVGSEMCIRDSPKKGPDRLNRISLAAATPTVSATEAAARSWTVSYTHLTLPTICSV
eukprot:12033134-Prorocentrum_lima.AAC.1